MLVLGRKKGEAIIISDNIRIRVLKTEKGQVRLGIEAPGSLSVSREEVYETYSGSVFVPPDSKREA
jgi:carbon storage regulator